MITDNLAANKTPAIRRWARRENVELCLSRLQRGSISGEHVEFPAAELGRQTYGIEEVGADLRPSFGHAGKATPSGRHVAGVGIELRDLQAGRADQLPELLDRTPIELLRRGPKELDRLEPCGGRSLESAQERQVGEEH